MVYLLQAYFGRDGREEAEAMLQRHAGDVDKPRILAAFNEPTPHWLAYFMFTYFTDRDGTTLVLADAPEVKVLATNKLDAQIDASPALVGNEIILRSKTDLYCIGK